MRCQAFLLLSVVAVSTASILAPLYQMKEKVDHRYIVKIKDDFEVDEVLKSVDSPIFELLGGKINLRFPKVKAFSAILSSNALDFVRRFDFVEFVEEVGIVHTMEVGSWGLDRIDMAELSAMDGEYYPEFSGEGVSVYVIDTGVNPTHEDLVGRCDPFYDAYPVGLTEYGVDCNGHGSHCAGTVAGTTYGVAKKAHIYGVRVLSCIGFGSTEGVVSGCEKVASDAILPAVASLSLGGGASEAMDAGIVAMVRNGVTSVVAAGNSNEDACLSSPAREETAITVSASDINDQRAFFSNYGSCSDIYAPGVLITSIWFNSDNSTNTISGTSMACPHVAGAAALILEENPGFSPSVVKAALVNTAVSDKIEDAGPDTPNKLLQVKRE